MYTNPSPSPKRATASKHTPPPRGVAPPHENQTPGLSSELLQTAGDEFLDVLIGQLGVRGRVRGVRVRGGVGAVLGAVGAEDEAAGVAGAGVGAGAAAREHGVLQARLREALEARLGEVALHGVQARLQLLRLLDQHRHAGRQVVHELLAAAAAAARGLRAVRGVFGRGVEGWDGMGWDGMGGAYLFVLLLPNGGFQLLRGAAYGVGDWVGWDWGMGWRGGWGGGLGLGGGVFVVI